MEQINNQHNNGNTISSRFPNWPNTMWNCLSQSARKIRISCDQRVIKDGAKDALKSSQCFNESAKVPFISIRWRSILKNTAPLSKKRENYWQEQISNRWSKDIHFSYPSLFGSRVHADIMKMAASTTHGCSLQCVMCCPVMQTLKIRSILLMSMQRVSPEYV